jgi:hypothetical protein
MKQEILNILGGDHTTPAVFNKDTLETRAIYTWKDDVFCLGGPGNEGMDFPFDDISPKGQADILKELQAKEFEFMAWFQG